MITILNLSQRVNGFNDTLCSSITNLLDAQHQSYRYIKTRELKITFCNNCRLCMKSLGDQLGVCYLDDDMSQLVETLLASDCIVVSSPINCYDLPSIMKIMLERMSVFCYWSDDMYAPKVRDSGKDIRGILITTSAMPGFLVPLMTKAKKTYRLFAKPLRIKNTSCYHFGFKGRAIDMPFSGRDSRVLNKIIKKLKVYMPSPEILSA